MTERYIELAVAAYNQVCAERDRYREALVRIEGMNDGFGTETGTLLQAADIAREALGDSDE